MPASLPTESAVDKAVNEFGVGTYDSDNGNGSRGEDDEDGKSESSPNGDALPGTHGLDPFGPDRLLSYPQTFASVERMILLAAGMVPGDLSVPTEHQHPESDPGDDSVPTVAEASELPDDHDNPSARSDYYDRMTTGMSGDEWADEDSGAWAAEKEPGAALPGVQKNETSMDDFLGALGNAWSGYETEDVSDTKGFPSTDLAENADFPRSNDDTSGGRLVATGDRIMSKLDDTLASYARGETTLGGLYDALVGTDTRTAAATGKTVGHFIDSVSGPSRTATNHELVGDIAKGVLKEFGKKGLTRRHVMTFLQTSKHSQYLASDVIRCLKLRHSVYVKDVLDEFPVVKTASSGLSSLASVRERLIQLEVDSVLRPEVSSQLRRCAASVSVAIADLERLEGRHG